MKSSSLKIRDVMVSPCGYSTSYDWVARAWDYRYFCKNSTRRWGRGFRTLWEW